MKVGMQQKLKRKRKTFMRKFRIVSEKFLSEKLKKKSRISTKILIPILSHFSVQIAMINTAVLKL